MLSKTLRLTAMKYKFFASTPLPRRQLIIIVAGREVGPFSVGPRCRLLLRESCAVDHNRRDTRRENLCRRKTMWIESLT